MLGIRRTTRNHKGEQNAKTKVHVVKEKLTNIRKKPKGSKSKTDQKLKLMITLAQSSVILQAFEFFFSRSDDKSH